MHASAGVIFDLDGVIVDSEELHFQAYSEVLGSFGVEVSREEYGREWIAAGKGPEYAVEAYGLPVTADELRGLKNPVYHEILRRQVRLMRGAREALSRLNREFPLALATNSSALDTGFILDHFDLRRHFVAVVTRERYREPKPAPDAFLAAAAALQQPPQRCVVIEDAYKGVVAAVRAGCQCIAVPHDFTRDNDFSLAAEIVSSLDDVTIPLITSVLDAEQ